MCAEHLDAAPCLMRCRANKSSIRLYSRTFFPFFLRGCRLLTDPTATTNTSAHPIALPLSLLLLLSLALFSHWQMQPIAALPEKTSETVFAAGRAYAQLQSLLQEQTPHPVDSLQNRAVEHRIVAQLERLNIHTEVQQAEACQNFSTPESGFYRCATVRNIIARIPGRSDQAPILLSAHYDSVPAAPGASDAGAAVVSLLEIARLLTLQPAPPRNGIVLLFNEGEEFGLLGAKAFMEQHPWAHELKVALNIEARGSGGASILFETGEDSGWLVQHYAATTPAPVSSSLFHVMYQSLPNDTDLTLFKEHGLQGLNFAHAERETHYHTPLDNLATLDHGSLQHHGENVWGVLQQIKETDLDAVPTGNRVFSDVLGLFVLSWAEATSLSISLGLAAVLIALIWRSSVSYRGVIKASGLMLCAPMIAGASASGVLELIQLASHSPEPWRTNMLPMRLAIWSAALLSSYWMLARLARASSMREHMLAQSLFWVILALISSVYLPGVSFVAIIPASLTLLGIYVARQEKHWHGATMLAASVLHPLSTGLCLLPIVLYLELLAGFHLAPIQGVLLGLTICSLMPVLVTSNPSRLTDKAFNSALTALLLTGALWTTLQPAYSTWMPQHLNLRYVQQELSAQKQKTAHVLIDSPDDSIPAELAHALGPLHQGPIAPLLEPSSRYSSVEHAGLAPTELTVISKEAMPQGRAVTLTLHTPKQAADMLTLLIPASAGLERIDVRGNMLHYPTNATTGHHAFQCVGLTCNNLELTLHLHQQSSVPVQILQSSHGLPASMQTLINARGASAVERHNGDRSLTISETSI